MALKDDIKGYFSDAKYALNKAGKGAKVTIEKFGNDSKTKIQVIQSESELSNATAELGKAVLALVESGRDTISRFDESLEPHFKKIEEIKSRLKNLQSKSEQK